MKVTNKTETEKR